MFDDSDGGVGSYDRDYGEGFDSGVCVLFESDVDWEMALLAAADVRLEPLSLDGGSSDWWARGEAELGLVAACERQIAQVHATQVRALARFVGLRVGSGVKGAADFLDDEVGVAVRWTSRFAGARLGLAYTLTERLPGTLAALEEGRIDLRRAEKIAEYTDPLSRELARAVEEAVLPKAGEQNTAQLARAAGRAVGRLDPAGAAARHQERKKQRQVQLLPAEDGMAELRAFLPAADAMRIHQLLTQYAHAARSTRDGRSTDQLRADALCDLLLDPRFGVLRSSGVQVQVTVALTTLMGLDEQPAELAGYGPIPAPVARELAGDGTWRRLVTDPLSGQLLDYGRTAYRPPAGLADFVRARDQHCVFPGCSRPATHCDIDHTTPHPHGPTAACNLACLCRRHHRLKHEGDWTLERDGDRYIWTTPTGDRYITQPPPLATPATPPAPPVADEPPPY